jgi:hypothetical protein
MRPVTVTVVSVAAKSAVWFACRLSKAREVGANEKLASEGVTV